jgi:hypothetical protein
VSSNFSSILQIFLFCVLILSWWCDIIFKTTWHKKYFTTGLPIFMMRVPVEHRHSNIPSVSLFDIRFYSFWASSLVFHEIELNAYGFYEKIIQFHLIGYTPIMHGLLLFDCNCNEVIVQGFLDWYSVWFSLLWLGSVAVLSHDLGITLSFVLFFVLLMGLLYWIQYCRFSNVAKFAAHAWSRKYLGNNAGA